MSLLCQRVLKFPHRSLQGLVLGIRENSNKCTVSKQTRSTYPRMYKTLLVKEDGSTVTIRFKEPKRIIKIPIDVVPLSDTERTKLWLSRQHKVEDEFKDEIKDDFKVDDYKHLWK